VAAAAAAPGVGSQPLLADPWRAPRAEVVLVTYAQDPEAERLVDALSALGLSPLLWELKARDDELSIEASPGSFVIERRLPSGCLALSSDDLASAAIVIYRPGLGRWLRPVSATSLGVAERAFAEREWSTLVNSLFLECEQRCQDTLWVNSPSASLIASQKYYLLATADLDGMRVPPYSVSTEGSLPPSASGAYVSKAINEDEDVDEHLTFPTSEVPSEVIAQAPFRSDCPTFIQERVYPDHELRVYYLLGEVLALRLSTTIADVVDIRLAPRDSLRIERTAAPPEVVRAIDRYCRRHRLSYCAFDFVSDVTDGHLLVDVTPSGSWSYFETAGDPFVTQWYAGIIADTVRAGRGSATVK
jgi:hypothetical protein